MTLLCLGILKNGAKSELTRRFLRLNDKKLFVVFGFQNFTTTVKAVWADVVTQMRFTCGWFRTQLRRDQEIVRTVHAAF